MEKQFFITNHPSELIATSYTPAALQGKLFNWKHGYGKYVVVIILLYLGHHLYDTRFSMSTSDNWFNSLFDYLHYLPFLLLAYWIYKGRNNEKLLVINNIGIFYNKEAFLWSNVLSFQLSLEKEMNKQQLNYYLHLKTKNNVSHKIDISGLNKKFNEIHDALLKNSGKNEVIDLGFRQII